MRQTLITVLTLIIVSTCVATVQAQAANGTEQKSTTPATTSNTDQPNEVEQALAEAKKKGETVLGVCIENCGNDADKVIEGFDKGHAVALPKPAYPPIARAAHVAGTVEVLVLIDFDGKVIAATAISGHPLLYAVSVKAARDAEFSPMKLYGQPVKVTGIIQYNFVAQ